MGRKICEKDTKLKEKNEKQKLKIATSPEPEEQFQIFEEKKLKALDILNILTRKHLNELLKEYELLHLKHSTYLNQPCDLNSCRDLKMEEISRLDQLIQGFSIRKDKMKASTKAMQKGIRNIKLSTPEKKNVVGSPDKTDNVKCEAGKEAIIEASTGAIKKMNSSIKLSTPEKKNVFSPVKTDNIKSEAGKEVIMEASTRIIKKMKSIIKLSTPEKKNVVGSPDKTDNIKCETGKEVMMEASTGATTKVKSSIKLSTPKKKNVCSPDETDNEHVVDQEIIMKASTGAIRKDRSKLSTSSKKKKVVFRDGNTDKNEYEVNKRAILKLHNFNIHFFITAIHYDIAGFNKYRYDQIPNVHEFQRILYFCKQPNLVLQETLLSLKISEEAMISEDIKQRTIRILSFVIKEYTDWLYIHIKIPNISKYDRKKFDLRLSVSFITFFANDLDGKFYVFEMYNLYNKVKPETAHYQIPEKDTLIICAQKKKRGLWKEIFAFRNQTKSRWEEEMTSVLSKLKPEVLVQLESIEFIWNVSLILANCNADFENLPPNLNHVNWHFKSLEEMIFLYTEMIKTNVSLKALIYILGGALLKMLMKTKNPFNFKKASIKSPSKNKEKNLLQSIYVTQSQWKENLDKGNNLLFRRCKPEEAYQFFCKAVNSYNFPEGHLARGVCLFQMKRYKESFIDSIFAIRNLGPYNAYKSFVICLKYKMITGYVITAIDQTLSLEHNYKGLDQSHILMLNCMRQTGLNFLNNIFKSYLFIFQKKFKDAIPFLEKAESIEQIKSEHTCVILLLLYFICKNYGKVKLLGNRILEDYTIYRNLVFSLLGMSSYYMNELAEAVNYLKEVKINVWVEPLRIKQIQYSVYMADDNLEKKFNAESYYEKVLELVNDNDQLEAHALTKLGVLNYMKNKYLKGIDYLTRSIKIVGKTKNVLVVRNEMHNKLGMREEAKEDYLAVKNLE